MISPAAIARFKRHLSGLRNGKISAADARHVKAVDYWQNADGTWTGRIFSQTYNGTREQVSAWLRANGASP